VAVLGAVPVIFSCPAVEESNVTHPGTVCPPPTALAANVGVGAPVEVTVEENDPLVATEPDVGLGALGIVVGELTVTVTVEEFTDEPVVGTAVAKMAMLELT
jgi:hypothetical protein